MKYKIKYLMFVTGMSALMCACSSENANVNTTGNSSTLDESLTAAIKSICTPSEQAVMMSGGGSLDASAKRGTTFEVASKSTVGYDDGTFSTDDGIGMFMLATSTIIDEGGQELPINWAGGTYTVPDDGSNTGFVNNWLDICNDYAISGGTEGDVWSVYWDMNNARAEAVVDPDQTTHLEWAATDNHQRYYPVGNYHTYSFFAYSPWQEKSSIEYEPEHIYANILLDGSQEVLWGCAKSENFVKDCIKNPVTDPVRFAALSDMAYSANFFREPEARDAASDQPKSITMNFEHKLVTLKCQVTPGEVNGSYVSSCNLEVDSICIVNVPSAVKLCLADRSGVNPSEEGSLTSMDDSGIYWLKNSNSGTKLLRIQPTFTTNVDQTVTPDTVQAGDNLLIPRVPYGPNYKLMMFITYPDKNNKPVHTRLIYPQAFYVPANWKDGEEHTLTLTIYHPLDIAANASLTQWKIVTGNVSIK